MESHACSSLHFCVHIHIYRVDESTKIPPTSHSDQVTDILYLPQQINGEKKDGRLTI